jgi:HD-GYP domain-containing protein (c-di-GMP phosphodiesterase class II)
MATKPSSLADRFKQLRARSGIKPAMRSFETSSVVHKFNIFFVLLTLIPLGVLLYLYYQIVQEGRVTLKVEELNSTLIIVVIGIAAGYIAMRMLLKNLVDMTNMSVNKIREYLGPEKIQEFLQGDENEIALLTRTFHEITARLEENILNLETTKKTLHSVLNRVGQGISTMRNIDTFFDLIVETMTEALGGSTSPFAPAIRSRTALIIPKIQYLSQDGQSTSQDLDYPVICAPLILHDEILGILAVSGKKHGDSFNQEEMALLFNLATQTAVAIENSKLSENAGKTYFETLTALAMAVEARDPYSRGHLERVGQYCIAIAQYMGLTPEQVGHLRDAAKLHDIGKIGITDDVLSKQGPLSEQEWAIMRRHPEIGESIISSISSLKPLCDIIRHHHEKLDGSGYPDKLKGDQISLSVRILSVADIYDALVTDRPYRKGMPLHQAEAVLRAMVEALDQKVVGALFQVVGKP